MSIKRITTILLCTLFLQSLTGIPSAHASSVKVEVIMHVYQPINSKFDRYQVRLGDEFPSRSFLAKHFLSNCKKLTYFRVGDSVKVIKDADILAKGKISSVKIGDIYYKRYFGEDGETYNEYFAPCIFTGTVSSFKPYKGSIALCIKNFALTNNDPDSQGVGTLRKNGAAFGPIAEVSAWWSRISCEGFERPWSYCYSTSSSYSGC